MAGPSYVPGDYYRICDVCGFQCRASATFKRWDGLITCSEDWEPRHPQDFVRGRVDRQKVPEPRPEPLASFVGPLSTTISAAGVPGDTTISVTLSTRFFTTDQLGIVLDSGDVFRVTAQDVLDQTSITLADPLPGSVSPGNLVTNYSVVSEPRL